MSSKFFTWTKGDRRNAQEALQTGGVVPIPVECLKIKGMEYGRSAKGMSGRRPLPLSLDQQSSNTPPHSSRTSGSIALHDAAVQSATSLMAVMNDMLRSPQLSAHISSQHRPELTPTYARPRSHTAPSTPLVEAPLQEPVELPGSIPLDVKKTIHLSLPYTTNDSSDTTLQRLRDPASYGSNIIRPHSSPQEKGGMATFATFNTSADDTARMNSSKRPSLSVMQPRRSVSPELASSALSSQGGSLVNVPRIGVAQINTESEDPEAALLDEIARLRVSQDAYVCSLKEAHEQELACQRSYITFLEKRRSPATNARTQSDERLHIDTSHSGSKTELFSEPSATTLKSFESAFEDQKRASQEVAAEMETLKRKLSLSRKAQVDAVELRQERDLYRDTADRGTRRIAQLKDIVRKAKDNERALRNAAADLEARLTDANNERTDVLEGFYDACSQLRTANERERRLAQELDSFRCNEGIAREASETPAPYHISERTRSKHNRTVSDASTLTTVPPGLDPVMTRLAEAQRSLAAKDRRIKELEEAGSGAGDQILSQNELKHRLADLEDKLEHQKAQLGAAQSDAERYNSLLHNELRRQTRRAAQSRDVQHPQIEAEAFMVASEKMARLRSRAGANGDVTSAPMPIKTSAAELAATLEKELDHCIREIVMYKLDIKGYRKDLKKANGEIDALRTLSAQRPPTPDRDSISSGRSKGSGHKSSADRTSEQQLWEQTPGLVDSGLGIRLPQLPKTPIKQSSIAAATAAALSPPLASPPPRTRTPFNTYKRLPKPPGHSRTPSPLPSATKQKWPEQDITRTETLRSLSESIISSYAKRNATDAGSISPEPMSEPLGTIASPGIPVSEKENPRLDPAPALG